MHLVIFTKDVLHTYGLSTWMTAGLFIGAGYGFVRLIVDLGELLSRPKPQSDSELATREQPPE